ncbi:hypothetical protein SAMN04487830_110106 [Pseudobutyrivibrio sp. OR37]|nr:hypothetical protein SAMN04487830_110106 [Pseudobutyrivibrio sp. OR37]
MHDMSAPIFTISFNRLAEIGVALDPWLSFKLTIIKSGKKDPAYTVCELGYLFLVDADCFLNAEGVMPVCFLNCRI